MQNQISIDRKIKLKNYKGPMGKKSAIMELQPFKTCLFLMLIHPLLKTKHENYKAS